MKSLYRRALVIVVSFVFAPASLFAASLASDKASDPSYSGGWTNGSNGGAGWGAGGWALVVDGHIDSSSHFIGSSTNNNSNGDTNSDGDIDTAGVAWGMQADSLDVEAIREFDGALSNGQKFVISMDNGPVTPGGQVGFLLRNDGGETRLQFLLKGGEDTYDLESVGPATGIASTDEGLRIEVELVDIDHANVFVTTLVDGTSYVFSNITLNASVSGGHEITSVDVELCNTSTSTAPTNQAFYNSMYILPNPTDTTFFADQSLGVAASPNPVVVNSNLTYTITATNNGPAAATSVTVTDVPPSGVTFVSATSPQGTCTTDALGQVICDLGLLASNATATITLVVTPPATGDITNITTVSALNVDPNPGDNAVTNIVSVVTAIVAPVASFTASQTSGAAPLDVTFTDTSTGTITNYSWTFGDGGTSASSSPSHTYTNAGSFDVALTVSGPGGSSVTNLVDLITVTNVIPAAPVASFTASQTNGAAPLNVTFTDTSTGTITNYSWTFGDGGTSASSSPSHTYTNAGSFDVALTVSGPGGSSPTNLVGLITVTNAPPVASFTASRTNGAAPLNVTFTDTSTGTITNYSWTFGDGGTSTSSSPSHSYTNAGLFSVALTVFGPLGSSATNLVNLITVTNGAPPTVSIVRPATGMLYPSTFTNQTITIVATASDSDGISKIEFFDGVNKLGETTSNPGTNLWHSPALGSHTLRAVAHDTLGASNTSATVTVTIGAKNSPLGDWAVTISGADKGVEFVTFQDDFSASGYDIRLKKFGLNDVSGTWGFDAKGRLTGSTGSFIEQLGSATNWTGTLAGSAKSVKSLSGSVITTVGVFHWKGVPATTSPDLSGTWTGVVTVVKAPTPVRYAVRTNANDSGVFDVTTTIDTSTVIGQLIETSRNVVYGYVAVGGTNITMSGTFKDKSAKALPDVLTFKGKDATADKVSIQLFRQPR
jgi:uncharacterized repeat protein (TIGR01451 family)